MLSRIRQWITEVRAKRETHALAWHAVIQPKTDGLSSFQRMAAAALVEAIPAISLTRAGQREAYLTGQIPGSNAEVFIHYSQAQVVGNPELFGEFQDYNCPADLVREFVAVASRACAV